jgi:hypothetical protein
MATPYVISSDLVSAYPAKSLEIAQYIDGFKADLALVQNAQTGTTYTLAAADFTKTVTLSNASPVAVTLPLEATVPWPAGTQLRLLNLGAGLVTVAGAVGVTINGSPLTLAQYKDATLIKTGTDVWTFVGSAAAPGMDLITPTSVAGAGVTLSGGQVTFTAASTVSVNGCYSSAYANYIVIYEESARSGAISTYLRMRVSGSDSSASNYAYKNVALPTNSATVTWAAQGNGSTDTSALLSNGDSSTTNYLINVASPFIATSTKMGFVVGSTAALQGINAAFTAATSFDGFTIYTGSGNITGTIRIYGLRNS